MYTTAAHAGHHPAPPRRAIPTMDRHPHVGIGSRPLTFRAPPPPDNPPPPPTREATPARAARQPREVAPLPPPTTATSAGCRVPPPSQRGTTLARVDQRGPPVHRRHVPHDARACQQRRRVAQATHVPPQHPVAERHVCGDAPRGPPLALRTQRAHPHALRIPVHLVARHGDGAEAKAGGGARRPLGRRRQPQRHVHEHGGGAAPGGGGGQVAEAPVDGGAVGLGRLSGAGVGGGGEEEVHRGALRRGRVEQQAARVLGGGQADQAPNVGTPSGRVGVGGRW
ncbi:hypothetical protein BU14_0161s0037 [Porphyra umbilicalis]|uniref:Uncharacterized protein n=1 Tax=Porphyra umbilicalis TaxID=2786 RepID=A0A1X6P8P8_PORUM|nr:hypothetical protein BU14_0161s0037 [Porphyra umbilicalis]|eukprot:OSX77116.1 hypothetical protein BU14_0161s0037 [Porphyra umbilicalis]